MTCAEPASMSRPPGRHAAGGGRTPGHESPSLAVRSPNSPSRAKVVVPAIVRREPPIGTTLMRPTQRLPSVGSRRQVALALGAAGRPDTVARRGAPGRFTMHLHNGLSPRAFG